MKGLRKVVFQERKPFGERLLDVTFLPIPEMQLMKLAGSAPIKAAKMVCMKMCC